MAAPETVRITVIEAARAHGVVLGPAEDDWSVRGVPLAPFPARLRMDLEQELLWHDVVAAEVVPPVTIDAIVEGIAFPRPEVRLMVGEARWMVALSYPLPFSRVTTPEVIGLLSAGALYAMALAVGLAGHLSKGWRARLQEHDPLSTTGPAGDPRGLLRSSAIVAWPDIGQ